jgi:peptide/nickel transport system permease protein
VTLASIPEFVVGIALILVFAVWMQVLPIDSSGIAFGTPIDNAKAYVLPALALVTALLPQVTTLTRASAREVLATPYIRAALLRGLPRRKLLTAYVLPNTAGAVATIVATNMIYLLGGVIVVEAVFNFPGAGSRLVEAIGQGDAATVQALALAIGAMTIVLSMATDLVVKMLNPRLRDTL